MKHSWPTFRLDDVCAIRPPKIEARNKLKPDEMVSFLPMESLGILTKYCSPLKTKKLKEVEGSYTYFGENDLLLAKITPCFENGKIGIAKDLVNGVGFGSSEYVVFRCKESIYPEYLYYFLSREEFRVEGARVMSGAVGHKRVPKDFIENYEIPLPTLAEQKRIVAILDRAFAVIDKAKANAEKNLQNAKELFESYLNGVFDPSTSSGQRKGERWEEKKLSEVCTLIMGQSPAGETYNIAGDGVPLINGPVEFGKEPFSKTIKSKFTTDPTKYCKEGDLILCVRGSTTGRINIAGFDACIGRGVAAIRYSKNQPWLNYFILSSRQRIYEMGTGATFPNVSGEILKNLLIPIPPLQAQKEIVLKLEALSAKTNKLEVLYMQKIADLDELKKSILQKAFAGELKTERLTETA